MQYTSKTNYSLTQSLQLELQKMLFKVCPEKLKT